MCMTKSDSQCTALILVDLIDNQNQELTTDSWSSTSADLQPFLGGMSSHHLPCNACRLEFASLTLQVVLGDHCFRWIERN